MKYLFIDVETTGIDPSQCAIIQLSGIVEIDDKVVREFNFRLKPHPGAAISPEALAVTQLTEEEIQQFPPPYEIYEKFISILEEFVSPFDKKDKFFFCAYNAQFDAEFIRQFFTRNHNQYFGSYFWHPPLDIMYLASEKLKHIRHTLPNFKLGTIAKHFGLNLSEDSLHDSLYDIQITKQIYTILTNKTSNSESSSDLPLTNTGTSETSSPNSTQSQDQTLQNKDFSQGLF